MPSLRVRLFVLLLGAFAMGCKSSPPAGEAAQQSGWVAMVARWEASTPTRLVLVDGVPRSFSYVRTQVPLESVWDLREVSPKETRALSTDSAAANGAFVITTRAHATGAPR